MSNLLYLVAYFLELVLQLLQIPLDPLEVPLQPSLHLWVSLFLDLGEIP